jgi:hypothetical protein
MHLDRSEAEHHARTALALRADPESHLAEADRILLSRLRELRTGAHEPTHLAIASPPAPLPHAPEAEV